MELRTCAWLTFQQYIEEHICSICSIAVANIASKVATPSLGPLKHKEIT